MNRQEVELFSDVDESRVMAEVRRLVAGQGWEEGATSLTPNRRLVEQRRRGRRQSFDLVGFGYGDFVALTEVLRRDHAGMVGARFASHLAVYEHGEEVIYLDPEGNGEFYGAEWSDLQQGEHVDDRLPASLPWPDEASDKGQFITALIDHLYGVRSTAAEPCAEFYRPFVVVDDSNGVTEAVRWLLAETRSRGEMTVAGLGRFGAAHKGIWYKPARELTHWLNNKADKPALGLDCLNGVDKAKVRLLKASLEQALDGVREEGKDQLVGRHLCIGCNESPTREAMNPQTGEPIVIAGRKSLYVLIDDPELGR